MKKEMSDLNPDQLPIESFSEHDYVGDVDVDNITVAEEIEVASETTVGGTASDGADFPNGRTRNYRSAKKPDTFIPAAKKQPKQRKPMKRKSAGTTSGGSSAGKKGKTKKQETKYEVGYLFGKRPDKERIGKVEYHVFWKGFNLADSTWEPEENLRFCQETVDAYERGLGQLLQKAERDHGNEDDDEENDEEQANDEQMEMEKETEKVTVRKRGRGGKKPAKSAAVKKARSSTPAAKVQHSSNHRASTPKPAKKQVTTVRRKESTRCRPFPIPVKSEKQKPLPTIRARATTTNRISARRDKRESTSSAQSSHQSTSSSSNSRDPVAPGPGPSAKSKMMMAAKIFSAHQQQDKNAAKNGGDLKLNGQNIVMIDSVTESDISGVGLIAQVVFKDGSTRRFMKKTVQDAAPDLLIEYYERALGLIR